MGEIYILAVAPRYQRQGIGKALMTYACDQIKQKGMEMVMVETGGDLGRLVKPMRTLVLNNGPLLATLRSCNTWLFVNCSG